MVVFIYHPLLFVINYYELVFFLMKQHFKSVTAAQYKDCDSIIHTEKIKFSKLVNRLSNQTSFGLSN